MAADEDERFDWDAWWRVPDGLPEVDVPPRTGSAPLLAHHADTRTVAEYDPATGAATPRWRLAEGAGRRDERVDGRYLPIRSGTLAYYRDADGRRVVQHRRRRVICGPEVTCRVRGAWAARTLQFLGDDEPFATLKLVDAPARWRGPAWLRIYDFTWFEPDDFDLVLGIEHDLNGVWARRLI